MAKLVIPGHRVLGWNEILRKSLPGRLGQKKVEKLAIAKAFNTSYSFSLTGLDLSTQETDAANTLKMLSSKKG